jgi:putative phosphoserine phosphatase / 1-acylglycerol-3-phosphate O-acyltransferase
METISSENNYCSNSYTVFFDLDKTLINEISGKALITGAFKKGIMNRTDLVIAVYNSVLYKLGFADPLKIIDKMVSWVAGMSEKEMSDLCIEVFYEILLPSVYDKALSEIKMHQEKGAKTVILSSALNYICNEAAMELGMDDIICSVLEVKEGYLTGRPDGRLCFGEEKKVRLTEYCEINNTTPSDAWYYGDSISDFAALNFVGNPVCINPDAKLKRAANKRGWRILKWDY